MSGTRFVLDLGCSAYPVALAQTPDPPKRLYGIGDPSALLSGLAVIGSRKATPYGLRCTRMLSSAVASAGITIISGAAIGCDSEAHSAALDAGGASVAVLGCGADVDYPLRSSVILRSMRERYAVVSEMPFGSPPTRWSFVRRNRIIAGLARAVLVVEAGLPSGTFSTADAALDAGRDVFAVPGSILSPESRGSNRLIRQGAIPITDVSELAQTMGFEGFSIGQVTVGSNDRYMRALAADPLRPDDLARALGIDIVSTARTLGGLEAAGHIVRYPDGRYGLK